MKTVGQKISDRRVLGLVQQFLDQGIMEETAHMDSGTNRAVRCT